ncbi:secondary thiamine-phosphate synthase enzyme YjbQ [Flexistipes sp.]|uniref:secondary thiamine-phosphate synthase enzyme YjbQ n=1 Tax=Flexistipes sp. TaxID=3088135 RepID=UPI002E1CB20A|nr:secondary thiamine-phosphate synthase enzyme YjbQ [Flexistipes sp.]
MKITATDTFSIQMESGFSVADITGKISDFVEKCGFMEGTVNVFAKGSTASVTTTEYEPGTVKDLRQLFHQLAPEGKNYEHHKTWNDGNGHSHLQASILGPSITLPVQNGKILTGTWQQIILINHDIRVRKRTVVLTALGSFY